MVERKADRVVTRDPVKSKKRVISNEPDLSVLSLL